MKRDLISKVTLAGFIAVGLISCASKPTVVVVKPPRHVCDEYSAHIAGVKDGMHHEAINYEYANTNSCNYNDDDINKSYLSGYEAGRNMK